MLRDTYSNNQRFKQGLDGILYYYDMSRSLFTSTDRQTIDFAINHSNISIKKWMEVDSRITSNNNSNLIKRKSIITCISVRAKKKVSDCIFKIRKDQLGSNIETITLKNQSYNIKENLSVPLSPNDILVSLLEVNSGKVDYPILSIEYTWVE